MFLWIFTIIFELVWLKYYQFIIVRFFGPPCIVYSLLLRILFCVLVLCSHVTLVLVLFCYNMSKKLLPSLGYNTLLGSCTNSTGLLIVQHPGLYLNCFLCSYSMISDLMTCETAFGFILTATDTLPNIIMAYRNFIFDQTSMSPGIWYISPSSYLIFCCRG